MKCFLCFLLCSVVFFGAAQDIVFASSASEAMKLCKEKAIQSPKELQQQMLSSCTCTVKKTDFKAVKTLSEAGKTKELQTLYQKATEACLRK